MTDKVTLVTPEQGTVSAVLFYFQIPKENILLKEYLKAQNKINESVIENVFSSDELHRFLYPIPAGRKQKEKIASKPVKKGKYTNLNSGKIISLKCHMNTGDS